MIINIPIYNTIFNWVIEASGGRGYTSKVLDNYNYNILVHLNKLKKNYLCIINNVSNGKFYIVEFYETCGNLGIIDMKIMRKGVVDYGANDGLGIPYGEHEIEIAEEFRKVTKELIKLNK